MANQYYVKRTWGGMEGMWAVMKKRKYWFDEKVSVYSIWAYGTEEACLKAIREARKLNELDMKINDLITTSFPQ